MDNFQVIEGAGPFQFGNWINSLLKTSNLATTKTKTQKQKQLSRYNHLK
jgi:hypothetical protein